jgi:hypothetical protein
MQLSKSLLVDVAVILGLILVGVVGYKLSPLLLPQADMTLLPEPGCNLHAQACAATLPEGGVVRLAVTPRPIPVTTPLEIVVELEGLQAERVSVDFAGIGMAMGFNRPELAPAGAQRFAGQATLPVCVTGRMEWQATVLVESGRRRIAIPYRFESGH